MSKSGVSKSGASVFSGKQSPGGQGKKKKQKADSAGRNGSKCKNYKDDHQREKNKEKWLKLHLAAHPNDAIAKAALKQVWA